jgi:hypothetical protein
MILCVQHGERHHELVDGEQGGRQRGAALAALCRGSGSDFAEDAVRYGLLASLLAKARGVATYAAAA